MQDRAESTAYREEGGFTLIEVRLRTRAQLYNSLDPAPFHERDLDDRAADYLREAMEDLRGRTHIKLRIHLQEGYDADSAREIEEAVRNDFRDRARKGRMVLKQQFRVGRVSLVVGLLFLAACLELRSLLPATDGITKFLGEGMSIIGWVAMWKPLDIFLYSWWPMRADIRLHDRIASMPVEVVGPSPSEP